MGRGVLLVLTLVVLVLVLVLVMATVLPVLSVLALVLE
jgi:hypothetical protein